MTTDPLYHQHLFKAALLIPFFSFLSFGLIAWIGHKPQLDADGLNNFLSISKLPLALFSLAAPFGVLINNIHRTIQTKAQILETQKKNTSDIYYSHQKNITELISSIDEYTFDFQESSKIKNTKTYNAKVTRPIKLYRKIFHKSTPKNNDFSLNFEFIYTAQKKLIRIEYFLKKIKENNESGQKDIKQLSKHLSDLLSDLKALGHQFETQNFFRHALFELDYDEFNLSTMFKSESEIICLLVFYLSLIQDISDIIGFKTHTQPIFTVLNSRDGDFLDDIFKNSNFIEKPYTSARLGYKDK